MAPRQETDGSQKVQISQVNIFQSWSGVITCHFFQVLPGYAPSYATDYVPPEVSMDINFTSHHNHNFPWKTYSWKSAGQRTLVLCFCKHYIIQCFPLPHTIGGEFSILYGSEASASSDHLKCTYFELKWWLLGLALNQLRLKSFVRVKFSQQFTYCIKVVDSKAYTKRKSSGDSRPSSAEPPEVVCNYHFVTAITSFHLLMLSGLVVKLKTIFVIFSSGLKGIIHYHDHHQH